MTGGPRLTPMPALDGLRGLAVAGVLAFHLGYLQGGFLGVDLFFVLSGFLITSLLLVEHRERGTIDLVRFWARRARRLLPALLVVLAAVAAYTWLAADPAELDRIRGDALATLGYVANWREVFSGRSYWDMFGQPSPLEHTWSLAIEEQFYIVWPLVVAGVLTLTRGSRRVLLTVTTSLAVASAAAMIVLHQPFGDPSRVYFGTDTRATGILMGAVLAILVRRHRTGARDLDPRVVDAIGAVALVALLVGWFVASGTSGWLYEGGFVALELAAVVVIWAVARSSSGWLGRVLSAEPLHALGLISYGLYLWHWPVFVALTPDRTGLEGPALAVARVAVSVVLAVASYRLVEAPVRHGALPGWRIRALTPAALASTAALVVVATVGGTSPRTRLASPLLPAAEAETPLPAASIGTARDKTTVLVAGDSGAVFLGTAMEGMAADHDAEIVNLGRIGCGVMHRGGGLVREEDGAWFADPPGCDAQLSVRWREEVERIDPDVVLLMLGWPGLGLRRVAGQLHHACVPEFDEYYRSEVDEAIDVLGRGGAKVVIATVPPVARGNLPAAVDPRQRADCLNRIYRDMARSHPRTTVLDVSEWACPEARCPTEVAGAPLRPDGVHFEATGAALLADWALPKMLGTGRVGGDGGRDGLSVLVTGDSTALVLAHRFPAANHPRLALTEATALGCGVTRGQAVSGDRGMPADCDGTRARYLHALTAGRPAVVVLMAGAWEVFDHRVDGVTHRFGSAEWEAIVREGLATYVTEAAAAGARVVMLTAPCFDEATDPRFPTPERNDHERVDAYNRLVREVAAANGAVTSVVDYGARVCRDGRPTAELGDGVHLTPEGAARTWAWLAPLLF